MRRLTVSVPIRAPSGFTLAYLRTYFQERAHGTDAAELCLRLPLTAIAAGVSVEKPVDVEVRYVASDGDSATLGISWSARGTAAFPRFEGTFATSVERDVDCRLTLSGGYDAPGGIAGAAFDAVLGRRIARATIQGLLQRLAAAAESDYQTRMAM